MTATERVLELIAAERERQEVVCAAKRAEGENWRTPADPLCTDDVRLPVLAEEFGEVAKELNDARAERRAPGPNLRVELLQLAAVAVAWAEALEEVPR
jgi:putative heme iron utilization protein